MPGFWRDSYLMRRCISLTEGTCSPSPRKSRWPRLSMPFSGMIASPAREGEYHTRRASFAREREESGRATMEKQRTMKKRWVLDQAARRTIEETWAVFTNGTRTLNPALFLARLTDLARSNAFLWA